jgi:large subunit ribosomal protein L17
MAASLIQHGAIRTTVAKAKELRGFIEKIITTAKKGTLHARRQVISVLRDRLIADDKGEIQDKTVVQKLFDEVAPRYANRPGGYTRIIRLSERRIGDAGKQVLLQLVEETAKAEADSPATASRRRKRAAKRYQAAASAASAKPAAETPAPAEPKEEPKE